MKANVELIDGMIEIVKECLKETNQEMKKFDSFEGVYHRCKGEALGYKTCLSMLNNQKLELGK